MAKEKQLTISNPSIGGSGYLTLSNMEAEHCQTWKQTRPSRQVFMPPSISAEGWPKQAVRFASM